MIDFAINKYLIDFNGYLIGIKLFWLNKQELQNNIRIEFNLVNKYNK